MGDVMEATAAVFEALSELDPSERARVRKAVDALLEDPHAGAKSVMDRGEERHKEEARKPVPVPVQRVEKPASPKASGTKRSSPSKGGDRPSPKLDADRVSIMKVIDANPGCSLQQLQSAIPGRSLQCLKKALYSLIHDKEIVRTGPWLHAKYSPAGRR